MYQTYKMEIHPNNELFPYFDDMCFHSKNLYNTTNFYIRQVFTAFGDEELNENQLEVLSAIEQHLPRMNAVREKSYEKKKAKDPKLAGTSYKPFSFPTAGKHFLSFGFLDGLFKSMKQTDYKALPGQANQQTMRKVASDWKSFFESIKDYKKNPAKYEGRPQIPRYKKKSGRTVCTFTNQVAKITTDGQLKLPKTKLKLSLGKIAQTDGKLQQVRIVPTYGRYTVELVFEKKTEQELVRKKGEKNTFLFTPKRVMGVDLGVDVLAAIADNTGGQPLVIKGKVIKSVNHYYNKERAKYVGILRNGLQKNEGKYNSERLMQLDRRRNLRVMDYMHKTSYKVLELAKERNIDTIIIGKNDGWKKEVKMRKSDKQNFIQLPFSTLMSMIKYKAEQVGIQVVVREESYTSKACFLSMDEMPVYGEEKEKPVFSGTRYCRPYYRIKGSKTQIHADVNAAYNIIRKHVEGAFEQVERSSFLQSPKRIRIR